MFRPVLALALLIGLMGCQEPEPKGEATQAPPKADAKPQVEHPAQISSAEAERFLHRAQGEVTQGNVAHARVVLREGVRAHPRHAALRFELARLEYEAGEGFHLESRQERLDARQLLLEGDTEEAENLVQESKLSRSKAKPHYQSAREHLHAAIELEKDPKLLAWASFLLFRCELFFEAWRAALRHLDRSIELGKPEGKKLEVLQEYRAQLEKKIRDLPPAD